MNWGYVALVLGVLLLIAIYLLMRTVNRLMWVQEDLLLTRDSEHAKCIGAVSAFVGDHYAAQVLRVAAEDYDTITEQDRANRIAELRYDPNGGPSVPALWLHDRADHLLALAEPVLEGESA